MSQVLTVLDIWLVRHLMVYLKAIPEKPAAV